jgi:hypothetical protein
VPLALCPCIQSPCGPTVVLVLVVLQVSLGVPGPCAPGSLVSLVSLVSLLLSLCQFSPHCPWLSLCPLVSPPCVPRCVPCCVPRPLCAGVHSPCGPCGPASTLPVCLKPSTVVPMFAHVSNALASSVHSPPGPVTMFPVLLCVQIPVSRPPVSIVCVSTFLCPCTVSRSRSPGVLCPSVSHAPPCPESLRVLCPSVSCVRRCPASLSLHVLPPSMSCVSLCPFVSCVHPCPVSLLSCVPLCSVSFRSCGARVPPHQASRSLLRPRRVLRS